MCSVLIFFEEIELSSSWGKNLLKVFVFLLKKFSPLFVPTQTLLSSSKTIGVFWLGENELLEIERGSRGENLWFVVFPVFLSISNRPSSIVPTQTIPLLSSVTKVGLLFVVYLRNSLLP